MGLWLRSKLGRVVGNRTVRGRKPSIERHMDVLERVLLSTTRPSATNAKTSTYLKPVRLKANARWLISA
jgi:hypothetical protein